MSKFLANTVAKRINSNVARSVAAITKDSINAWAACSNRIPQDFYNVEFAKCKALCSSSF